MLKSIFIVALFETEGIDDTTGEPNFCERHKQHLKMKITAIEDIPNIVNDENDEYNK